MSLRIASAILSAIACCSIASAATREEEAKKYAGQLKGKDAATRLTALTELGKLGSLQKKLTVPYVSDIMKALEDSDAKVRGEAAKVVGLIDVDDKKTAINKIAGLLKSEKSEVAREGQETALGELGATTDDDSLKTAARQALMEARKKTDSKREQKVIQAAIQLITGKKKKD